MNAWTSSFAACIACAVLSPHSLSTALQESGATPGQAPPPQSGAAKPADAPAQSGAAKSADAKTEAQAGPAEARTSAQDKETPSDKFSQERIEQMVAPIALYPDGLFAQILMASTYPLEVVEAQRWVEKNPSLKGKQLETALEKQSWDASVKSLCGFADLLKRMSAQLDWMQDLGDAFLAQKQEVLDACQKLRKIAYDAGNLKTSEQQKVVVQEDKIIVIESASPEVIYVPTYSPTVVYTGWSYPHYYYPYPPGYGAMAFTAGVVWGAAIWGNCNWGHGHGDVNIDIDRYNNFNKVEHYSGDRGNRGQGSWQHNPEHRQGVNYRDSKTAQQFGGQAGSSRVSRDAARGYADRGGASAAQRPSTGASGAQRPSGGASAAQRPAGGASAAQRPAGGASASTRPSTGARSGASSNSALSGSRNANLDRAASSRGASSRGTSSYGGGGRSGGGRSGGGRGGGGRR